MAKKEDDFSFETLAQVYREERKSPGLTKLPSNFYKNLAEYLVKLSESYFQERKNDPTSSRSIMLEDEYNKAEKRASQIYEFRERKIALIALSLVNGGNPSMKLMTESEKKACSDLVEILKNNRSFILLKKWEDSCESESFLTSDEELKEEKIDVKIEDERITQKKEIVKEKEKNRPLEHDRPKENQLLLILEDIPSFDTEERSLNLKKDDAISLPKEVAQVLCRHKKARIIHSNEINS